ncbi:SMP-30/gluconolactonase/LRE family protein [Jiangella muralis]|uniref:SMP-30/gluconolactonase/LRE family protein n=1 Tax=Jiangella muralis TaxID=702383 RepID=UPI00069F28D0|nr:SMP-30/gluconolactonase/LRE family protein [Jiangella muralis]
MLDIFRTLADGLDHPEGLAWAPNGKIYTGGTNGQIYEVSLAGDVREIARTGGLILGIAVDGAGRVYACHSTQQRVIRVDPADGSVETFFAGTPDRPVQAPNWAVFDAGGTMYLTDSGGWEADDGVVFRIRPDGSASVWTDEPRCFANGAALSPDGSALYVVESTAPGVCRIPIQADGSAGARELFVELPGTVPDGIAFGADGTLFVACYRPDRIYAVSPDGSASVLADDPRGVVLAAPTNVAFVGAALETLVVASLGRWHLAAVDLGIKGAPLNYPMVP